MRIEEVNKCIVMIKLGPHYTMTATHALGGLEAWIISSKSFVLDLTMHRLVYMKLYL